MSKRNTGGCDDCGQKETVEHIMTQCLKYEEQRRHTVQSIKELKFNHHEILNKNNKCYRIQLQHLC